MVTCFSCMTSSRAAWVLGGVRLISSAIRMFVNTGPRTNLMNRCPLEVSSSRISVPLMSEGIRSGVNWIRLKSRSSTPAREAMRMVLAVPGGPWIMQCPPASTAASTCSMASSSPTMIFRSSATIPCRAALIRFNRAGRSIRSTAPWAAFGADGSAMKRSPVNTHPPAAPRAPQQRCTGRATAEGPQHVVTANRYQTANRPAGSAAESTE